MTAAPVVSVDLITRITEEPNLVLRNLRITQCYHDLSRGLATVVCPNSSNWSTFATWASKTAGESIRNEEVPRVLLAILLDEERLRPRVGPLFLWIYRRTAAKVDAFEQARDTIRQVSASVSAGNLKVFAELAPIFSAFIGAMQAPAPDRPGRVKALVDGLRPGPSDQGGQDPLKLAFAHYAAAADEHDASTRAQLILLANGLIGLHEQTRLQDVIKSAMNAPVAEVVTDGIGRLVAVKIAFALLRPFGVSRERVRAAIQDEWERVATRFSMTFSLPDGRALPLGGDHIPWPNQIPDLLRNLTNADLIAFLRRFDDDLHKLKREGASNWSHLSDRMGFILELFRAEQQTAAMFGPPFSEAALAEIGRGVVPSDGI
jgi:hypothetical protein